MAVEYNFDFEELNYNLYFFFNSSEDFQNKVAKRTKNN